MTIREHDLIDGFLPSSEEMLGLILNDSISWDKDSEKEHMYHLENKFNYYIDYIKNKKYESISPNKNFKSFIIEFRTAYTLPEIASNYMEQLIKEIEPHNISISMKIDNSSSGCGC